MNRQKSRGILDLKSTMNQFNEKHYEPIQHNNIYTIFTQQQDTNSIQGPIHYTPGDTGTYPGT